MVVEVVRTWCYARVSGHSHARMQLIKTDRRQCAGPFGWTVQPAPHYACCLRVQVPGVPRCKKFTHTQGEEKRLRGTPTSLPSPSASALVMQYSTLLGLLVCSDPEPSHLLLVFQHYPKPRRQDTEFVLCSSLRADLGNMSIQESFKRLKRAMTIFQPT